ncbi:hypothetical protein MASR1M45_12820 [Candidatus Kapaibacterium sp.]
MKNIIYILNDIVERNLYYLDNRFSIFFEILDAKIWKKTSYNPHLFIKNYKFDSFEISRRINHDLINDYLLQPYKSITNQNINSYPKTVLYISPEFGFHESFQSYAGGLGILAGDIIKTGFDSDYDIIGLTLFYSKGYFHQSIKNGNKQSESYKKIKPESHGLKLIKIHNEPMEVCLNLGNSEIKIRAYEQLINKSKMIYLTTDFPENLTFSRLTEKLYTGDRTERFLQEIVLGIGGLKFLDRMGLLYDVLHLNEGHAAFAFLEKINKLMKSNNINFGEALNLSRHGNIFTTHTPVIHGNEEFQLSTVIKYLSEYLAELGLITEEFRKLSTFRGLEKSKISMTALALNLASKSNGVSKLHSVTANDMWKNLIDNNDNIGEIEAITNGIHLQSWLSPFLSVLFEKYEINFNDANKFREQIYKIHDNEIFEAKLKTKIHFLKTAKSIIKDRFIPEIPNNISELDLDNTIFVGFARRFAEYKRADLLFSDIDSLIELLKNSEKKIMFFFSGKAHPKDTQGKVVLSNVLEKISNSLLLGSFHFISDYDIQVGRLLVQASDIWLNTPVKPLEACGTSGMKSALNMGINLSVDDGWWYEAFSNNNGFRIEDSKESFEVSSRINNTLLNEVLPLYSDPSKSKIRADMMRESAITIISKFTSKSMMREYKNFYNKSI